MNIAIDCVADDEPQLIGLATEISNVEVATSRSTDDRLMDDKAMGNRAINNGYSRQWCCKC